MFYFCSSIRFPALGLGCTIACRIALTLPSFVSLRWVVASLSYFVLMVVVGINEILLCFIGSLRKRSAFMLTDSMFRPRYIWVTDGGFTIEPFAFLGNLAVAECSSAYTVYRIVL